MQQSTIKVIIADDMLPIREYLGTILDMNQIWRSARWLAPVLKQKEGHGTYAECGPDGSEMETPRAGGKRSGHCRMRPFDSVCGFNPFRR